MKSLYKILPSIALAATLFITSCEKELDTYKGENGMYFDTFWKGAETFTDTIDVPWGMKNSSVYTKEIELVVKLFGNISSVDRPFEIVIEEAPTYVSQYKPSAGDGEEVEEAVNPQPLDVEPEIPTDKAEPGIDYVISGTTFVMPAGAAEVSIPITLMRRDDLHLCKRSFKVRLIENTSLKFLFSRSLPEYDVDGNLSWRPMDFQRIIRMDESFPIPTWWGIRGEPYFGEWSQKKAMLICDIMNIDRERWMADELQVGYLRFAGQYMQKYLDEQKLAGNTIYEDEKDSNGDPIEMVMGPESQL